MGTGSPSKPKARGDVFYRFEDATGRVHVVDSLDLVPQAERARAERLKYELEASPTSELPRVDPRHWPLLGGALLLVVGLWFVFRRFGGALRVLLRLALIAAVVALVGSGYLGWVRRSAGQSGAVFASPQALVDDAKSAVEKMNARLRAQEAELRQAEQAK